MVAFVRFGHRHEAKLSHTESARRTDASVTSALREKQKRAPAEPPARVHLVSGLSRSSTCGSGPFRGRSAFLGPVRARRYVPGRSMMMTTTSTDHGLPD